jgi:thiol-disulfide isomerase/thioredoxin
MTLALAVLLALSAGPQEDLKPLAIGDAAPGFSLPGVDGKTYSLADFAAAKILVVVFTSNHCPTAQAYEERLKKIVADYAAKGVALVAIQPNSPKGLRLDELGYTELGDSFADMQVRAKEKEFNFPYVDDGDTQKTSRAYGCKATPHAFAFDAGRKLRYAGRIDDSEPPDGVKVSDLRNALDALLAGKEVPTPMTKPFGCSTKWASKEESVRKYMEKLAAEPVTLARVDGAGLASLRRTDPGRLRLVCFWSSGSSLCQETIPLLVEINRMYRHRAFEMVTVAVDASGATPAVEAILKKSQCSAKNLQFAESAPPLPAFDIEWDGAMPFTLLLGADGKAIYRKSGKVDPLELKRAIVNTLGRSIDKKK